MMKTRLGVMGLGLAAAMCHGQVQQVAYTIDDNDPEGRRGTKLGMSTNGDTIVVMSSQRIALFDQTGTAGPDLGVADTGFPFQLTDTGFGRLFDARTEYDPINNRLWMLYSEDNVFKGGAQDLAALHLAVNKDPAFYPVGSSTISSLSDGHWWRYTGTGATTGNGGTAFDLSSDPVSGIPTPFRTDPLFPDIHEPLITLADMPAVSFHEDAVIVAAFSNWFPGTAEQVLVIIPTMHDNGNKSILDGERPSESDITLVNLYDLDDVSLNPGKEDTAARYYAVQEPYVQEPNANFFIWVPDGVGPHDGIRLTGLYKDSGQWEVQQYVVGGVLEDVPVPMSFEFEKAPSDADTPDAQWKPETDSNVFNSAVLTEDVNGEMKIFAVHGAADDGGPLDQAIVQWYVIDPHLSAFGTSSWAPFIEAAGRLDAGGGDYYLPVLCVNRQGVAFIEYTYSDDTTWPQVRRATLNSSYTTATQSVVQPGPSYPYDYISGSDTWAGYADMQADPGSTCDCWSVHTLVYDNGPLPDPTLSSARDVWLIENDVACNNANLNGDGNVDTFDMALFNDLFSLGARRVDMDVDGDTDATDAAIYQNAYDAATGP